MGEPDIDLYADDLDAEFGDGDYNHESNADLYDDVITPSDGRNSESRSSPDRGSPHHHGSGSGRRSAIYVGNLTWWTTDEDLAKAIQNLGVTDLVEIRFHENRANGQSKGYCMVSLGSEASLKIVTDKLPRKELHGQNPVITPFTRQNLTFFEQQSRKNNGGSRHDSEYNDRRGRDRDRDEAPRPFRNDNVRSNSQDRMMRNRPNMPPVSSNYQPVHRPPYQMQQRPPHQGPPPPAQYQQSGSGHPWMGGLPPPIHHLPPPTRPNMPPVANTNIPPPPGLQGPPIRPGTLPPGNMRLPPPANIRNPPPPIAPRQLPLPDTRGPPPLHPDWERQPPPQHIQQTLPSIPSRPPPMSNQANAMPPGMPLPGPNGPSPHLNPAFLQRMTSPSGDIYNRPPPAQFPEYRPASEEKQKEPALSDSEFDEIMSRNKSVSSSAISRSVSDASNGDYASAIETLVTAISLIKQSKVSNDERCKILISSLQDTLHGIESKSYGSRSKERARSRERERSRERSSRREKPSRRERSRSRDREYRDRSRERDRYHEDRYREKDRDHDRDRRSRH